MKIDTLFYANTNTYLIQGEKGSLLFDCGWAGSFPAFCACLKECGIAAQQISCICISHFHPDHCGIAQEIADLGPQIVIADVQRDYLHAADAVFAKEKRSGFVPIRDEQVKEIRIEESRAFLQSLGIAGQLLYTPGHSDDSISLFLDDGSLFVGDLNPLYELELHKGTQIGESWELLLSLYPKKVYYGHAKAAELSEPINAGSAESAKNAESAESAEHDASNLYALTKKIMHYIDRGMPLAKIQKKTGADPGFIEDVTRMYLTHQNVGVRGILDRIEIKGK